MTGSVFGPAGLLLDGCGPGLGERKGKSGVMGDNNLLLIERTELPLTQKWNAWKRPAAGANRANDGLQGQVCASTPRLQVQHSGALDTIYTVVGATTCSHQFHHDTLPPCANAEYHCTIHTILFPNTLLSRLHLLSFIISSHLLWTLWAWLVVSKIGTFFIPPHFWEMMRQC